MSPWPKHGNVIDIRKGTRQETARQQGSTSSLSEVKARVGFRYASGVRQQVTWSRTKAKVVKLYFVSGIQSLGNAFTLPIAHPKRQLVRAGPPDLCEILINTNNHLHFTAPILRIGNPVLHRIRIFRFCHRFSPHRLETCACFVLAPVSWLTRFPIFNQYEIP
jgi:hypothetical protein